MTFRRIFGHLLAAVSVASMLSAAAAGVLHPLFHGYLDSHSKWTTYFEFFLFRCDYRLMLAAFILFFLVVPVLLGLRLALRKPEPRFEDAGSLVGFGLLLLMGIFFNFAVAFGYALSGYEGNSF